MIEKKRFAKGDSDSSRKVGGWVGNMYEPRGQSLIPKLLSFGREAMQPHTIAVYARHNMIVTVVLATGF